MERKSSFAIGELKKMTLIAQLVGLKTTFDLIPCICNQVADLQIVLYLRFRAQAFFRDVFIFQSSGSQ